MSEATPWEAFLDACFPGYLLPEAYLRALPEDEAVRFLARLGGGGVGGGGGPRQLFLLRATSVLAAHADAVRELALERLPELAARRRHGQVEPRACAGQLRGRLDVPATLRRRIEGRRHEIVVRAPRPPRRAPEDVLLHAAVTRLLAVIRELRAAGVVGRAGWGAALAGCDDALDRALGGLPSGPPEPITAHHEHKALAARHPAYALALTLHRALREGLDARSPRLVARIVAGGALTPLAAHTRFELAVLLRLIQALAARPGWSLQRALVLSGRREIAELTREDGARVRLYYDQACLDPGPYDAGLRRYFDQRGRLRPDLTVVASAHGRLPRAVVIEVKLSFDPDYLAQGYQEAIVYRAE